MHLFNLEQDFEETTFGKRKKCGCCFLQLATLSSARTFKNGKLKYKLLKCHQSFIVWKDLTNVMQPFYNLNLNPEAVKYKISLFLTPKC